MQKVLPKSPVIAGLFVFSLLFSSCFQKKSELKDEAVLKVGEKSLNLNDFSKDLARRLKNHPVILVRDTKLVQKTKEAILKDHLIYFISKGWAEKNNVALSAEELDLAINKVREAYPNDIAFRESLAQENLSYNEWKNRLARSLIEKKVFEKIASTVPNPSEKELRAYFEENKKDFSHSEQVKLRQIVVSSEAKANELKKRLSSANFEKMATKYSSAPEASKGGLIGWVDKGTLEVFDNAFELKPKRVSEVFQSPYGYHIFLVEDKRSPSQGDFEEVKKQVHQKLLLEREQAVFSSWLDQQIKGTKVFKNDALIRAARVELSDR